MNDTTLLLIAFGFAIAIVAAVALAVYLILSLKPKKSLPENPSPDQDAGVKPEGLAPEQAPGGEELFRVVRLPGSENPHLVVGGVTAASPADLHPDQVPSVRHLLDQLHRSFVTPVPPPAPAPEPSPVRSFPQPAPLQELYPEPPPERPTLIDSLTRVVQPGVQVSRTTKTIAQQVDEILQELLAGSPLDKRGIRIADTPGGTLVMHVGLQKYNAIEDVPDPEIQAVLHLAVEEWKKRTG